MKQTLLVLGYIFICTVFGFSQEVLDAPYAFFHAGKYREAIAVAEKLIQQDKNGNISAYAVIGWSYLNLRQWRKALEIGKAGEAINRSDPRFLQIIGEAYYELKQDEKAKEYFAKYLQISPKGQLRSWVYYYLGNIYEREDKYYKAEISYTVAVFLEEERVSWWLSLASVYEQLEENNQAKDVYRKVLVLDSNNNVAKQKLQILNQN